MIGPLSHSRVFHSCSWVFFHQAIHAKLLHYCYIATQTTWEVHSYIHLYMLILVWASMCICTCTCMREYICMYISIYLKLEICFDHSILNFTLMFTSKIIIILNTQDGCPHCFRAIGYCLVWFFQKVFYHSLQPNVIESNCQCVALLPTRTHQKFRSLHISLWNLVDVISDHLWQMMATFFGHHIVHHPLGLHLFIHLGNLTA